MTHTMQDGGAPAEGPPRSPRTVPMAALAGAVVLVGLVAFALYRRNVTSEGAPGVPVPAAPAAGPAATTTEGPAPGGMITATAPIRMTPEASILSERYRCVCGCNDTLSVCTCKNPTGSEEMKAFLQAQVTEGKSPEVIDRAMAEKFGPASLLSNPAPPQTLPSHAGTPPPAGAKKR